MKYAVRWLDKAQAALANLWLQADSAMRKQITAVTHQIDQHLRQDPIGASESRANGLRILIVAPLGIDFRIEADGQTVSVLRVWLFRKRKP